MNMSSASQKNILKILSHNERERHPRSGEGNTEKSNLIKSTFEDSFDKNKFRYFVNNLLNTFDERDHIIPARNFKNSITSLKCIGEYENSNEKIDILIADLKHESSLNRARAGQKNCIAWHLKNGNKDGALVAFVPPNQEDWRFSFVQIDYKVDNNGKVREESTPSRRCSFLVGKNEATHTAQSAFLPLLQEDNKNPKLSELEEAFSVEKVTKEFYKKYRELFCRLKESLDEIIKKNKKLRVDFETKQINSADFSKKLLGQIVFLYFLQKKGWFGVKKGNQWGTGSKTFIRDLFKGKRDKNFFNDILELLFYNALNKKYEGDYNKQFQCRIPFLNGGLFKPIGGYDWKNTDILLSNNLFSNTDRTKEGDIGNGILDIFERYNFTVNENEPLEKEVAIDPEMLGKVFENLLEIRDRKSKGTYYTPREIVHYMCQESLINYLKIELKEQVKEEEIEELVKYGESSKVQNYAKIIDEKLKDIRICDPAVGSGAFPVGMMNEIIKIRSILPLKNEKERTTYDFKRHAIKYSLYGVDIDSGAIEIAKLRLWLSLVVDDEKGEEIQPLPNLDCKMICGNSLLESIYHKAKENPIRAQIVSQLKNKKNLLVNAYPKEREILLQEINQLKEQLWKNDIKREIQIMHEEMSQTELFSDEKTKKANKNKLNKLKIEKMENLQFSNMFDWHIDFSEIFLEKKGFDVVIGNPPYVKEGVNKSAFDGLRSSPYYKGKMDLWYFFACKGIDISRPDSGIVAFIAQNNWVTSFGASKMRDKVIKDTQILNLIDFGDFKIFEAGIQTMIMLFKKNTHLEEYTFDYRKLSNKTSEFKDMVSILKKEENADAEYMNPEINRNNLKNKKLTFSNLEIEKIFNKLLQQKNFKLTNQEIAQGIVCPQDFVNEKSQVILENKYKVRTGVFVLNNKEKNNLSLTKKELSLIKPYYTTKELFRWHGNPKNKKWVIYTDSSFKDKRKMRDYPNIKRHLDQFKKIITSDNKPYGLHRARKESFFKGEKIIAVRKCAMPTFTYVDFDSYVSATFYVIKTNRINQKYLTGILNSRLTAFWLKHRGKMQGSNYQIDKEPILAIPILKPSEDKQKPLVALVDKILTAAKKEGWPKTLTTQSKIQEHEKQIDCLVYKLYGLTPEEIKIVENS